MAEQWWYPLLFKRRTDQVPMTYESWLLYYLRVVLPPGRRAAPQPEPPQ